MSSTSRGGQRSDADFYASPGWTIRRLLEKCPLPAGRWLEPAAGDGAIIRAVSRIDISWTAVELRESCKNDLEMTPKGIVPLKNIEIHCPMDFFKSPWLDSEHVRRNGPQLAFQVCLTNPPFSLAMDFIQACRCVSTHSIFLLRLNFLGAEERANFMRETRPDLYILPERPEFAASLSCGEKPKCGFTRVQGVKEPRPSKCPGCGKKIQVRTTDSISYAFFHWWPRSTGKYVLLDSTPLEERKRG